MGEEEVGAEYRTDGGESERKREVNGCTGERGKAQPIILPKAQNEQLMHHALNSITNTPSGLVCVYDDAASHFKSTE